MTTKDCVMHGCGHGHGHGHCHGHWHWFHCKRHKLYILLLAIALVVGFIVLVVWLSLRPSKPMFYLQDASVFQLNSSSDDVHLLCAFLQVTVSSRNPNGRVGVYYDELDVFAQYKDMQITAPVSLPGGYQGHGDAIVWSPYLYGNAIGLAPYLAEALDQDQDAGFLLLHVRLQGRVRWKVGTWTSGHYHLHVSCPAFLSVAARKYGGGGGATLPPSSSSFRFQHMTACSVDV